jgi:Tfp pilus assembly protein PilF
LLLCKQGKAADAERTVLYALESDDHRPIGHVVLGTVMLYMNRPDEAERNAREALSLDANTPDAYLVLTAVHGGRSDYAAEVKDLDEFLLMEPKGSRADSVRGIRAVADGLVARLAQKP